MVDVTDIDTAKVISDCDDEDEGWFFFYLFFVYRS